jgi:HEAT repeat protein
VYHPLVLCLFAALLVAPAHAVAQATPPSKEAQLARGWTELAAGRAANAAEIAGRLLTTSPRDHGVVSLAVAAALAGPAPMGAIDTYEKWLSASRREDPFLLEEIGVGVLRALDESDDPRVRYTALGALARSGDAAARRRLEALSGEASLPVEAEAELARAGVAAGTQRLAARISAGGPQDKSFAIEALKNSGQPGVATAIAEGLRDPAPPTRMSAALALAELGATETIPQLKAALADTEPPARGVIQIALGLLGDPEHAVAASELAASPLPDYRLLHARQSAAREPQGPWVSVAEGLLNDPDPSVRLGGVELLLSHGRVDSVAPTLIAALGDPSGPLRSLAARLLVEVPQTERGYEVIRKALRDPLAEIRVEAARALLLRR